MTQRRVSKTDYSKIAGQYDKVRPFVASIWMQKIIDYGKIEVNCTVLDYGCGTGRYTLDVSAEKAPMVSGLDLSIDMLKQAVAKDESRDILWIQGDGQMLPFRDESFDCIYMTLVIHHMEDKGAALREIHRALKGGGRCVIMTNSHSRIKKHVLRDFPGIIALDLRRFPTVPCIKKAMREVGFTDIHFYPVQYDEYMPTDEYLERVRNKYISTLTLLSEKAFKRGFDVFQQRVREKYGTQILRHSGFDFIVGHK